MSNLNKTSKRSAGQSAANESSTKSWTLSVAEVTKSIKKLTLTIALLAVCMNLSAQYSGGTGTSTDPYQIKTNVDLVNLAHAVNMTGNNYSGEFFRLENDIDCGEPGLFYFPIGREATKPFKGTFNGNNNKILNLSMDMTPQPQNDNVGFFGYIDGATIENLGLVNVDIKGKDHVGAITGYAGGCEITNCYSTGEVSGSERIGGLVGSIDGTIVTNCHVIGTVSGTNRVGGVVSTAFGNSKVDGCSFSGEVNGDYRVGGVAGAVFEGSILNCYATSTVNGTADLVGGVAGVIGRSNINKCYSTGAVSGGNNHVGGVAGDAYEITNVENCYSTAEVSGNDCVGGVVGIMADGNVYNCYSTGTVSGNINVGGMVGTIGYGKMSDCAALNPKVSGSEKVGRIVGYKESSPLHNNIAFDGILDIDDATDWKNIGEENLDGEDISKEAINADGTLGERFKLADGWTTQTGKLPGLFGNTVEMPEHLRPEGALVITTTTLPDGRVDEPYTATLEATGDAPIEWAIVGTLPYGLTLAPATGEITGTPVIKGDFTFTVKATNAAGSAEQELTIKITEGEGIDEWNVNGTLKIYPNPTVGELHIGYATCDNAIYDIEIYDLMGRRVATVVRANNYSPLQTTTINVEFLPAGVYFLKIGNKTAKFVKQ